MAEYTITWVIQLDAETPEEAAALAREIQLDRASTATQFEVQDDVTLEIYDVDVECSS